jgi:glucose/arabinose dehydrogenase/azurin
MKRRFPHLLTALCLPLALAAPTSASGQEVEGTEPNRGGTIDHSATDPQVALERLQPAEGYEVSLFASEKDFPIGNPVALAFDSRGRLWVSTMPSYPHFKPGDEPNDKLIILEDTDGDGRADKHTVFADSLYLALGFELGDGGVYVSQQPNLVFLKDTDGDDRADERRILLHGFGTEDSHHSISAFTWDPGGSLYFQEGTFLHSQVETPYGPVRLENAGVWRYEPHTEKLSVLTSYSFSNPWGHVFDEWGQNFIADASSGNNFFGLPISGQVEYPRKHPQMRVFTPVVRPTAGAEIVRSRHFPEEIQGNFLVTNVIGFQGIKNHQIVPEGSGFSSREQAPLITSRDINFRPVEMEFAPDGSLYVTDWFNPLIGHMQYSLRDPRRDITHGRIWRITYPGRPLLEPVNLEQLSVPELLEQLKVYEDRTRYRVRRELRERDDTEVARELVRWIERLDQSDPEHERHLLEALWAQQARDMVDPHLLERLLRAGDPRARAAATRVLRYSLHRVGDPLALLRPQVNDPHPLVRLEGVVALSFVRDPGAAELALEALHHPLDYYLDYGLKETLAGLEEVWKPALLSGASFAEDNPEGLVFLLDRLKPEEVALVRRSEAVNEVLLSRAGVPREVRQAALVDLARQRGSPLADVLLGAIDAADAGTGEGNADDELAALLSELDPADLTRVTDRLQRLATGARLETFREGAWAALLRAEGDVERAWQLASRSERSLLDLLAGAATLREPALAEALVPHIRQLIERTLAASAAVPGGVRGRYVRLEQTGCCETQSMAEVEVLDGRKNVALAGEARQKSTASGGEARRAIDGNTAGDFRLGSVSQSAALEADPWWEVDLGEERPISAVRIWKRTDTAIKANMEGFTLRILDAAREPVRVLENGDAGSQPVLVDLAPDARAETRRAALRALVALEGRDAERLATFQDLLSRGIDADLAVIGADTVLGRMATSAERAALAEPLLRYARSVPSADRTGGTFARAVELGRALAATLPAEEGTRITRGFDLLLPKRLEIRAVEGAMRFDVEEFTVEAGREVEIVFRNPDVMPHNVVVTAPGAGEKVGRAADAMAAAPDAYERNFVPDVPEVLFATPLVSPAERVTLSFQAPENPGEYPFICTFPGHWITMKGVMTIVSGEE